MFLTILVQIWARYGFSHPFSWTEELARYCMVWAGLLGATCAFKRRLDPTVTAISQDAGRLRRLIGYACLALTVLIFLSPVLYHSFFGAGLTIERGFLWRSSNRSSPALGLNMALVGSIVPISCTVILVHLAAQFSTKENT